MDQTTLNEILRKHRLWLKDDPNGEHAHLKDADLRHANLEGSDLRYADLRTVNLEDADLKNADLRHAYLKGANLKGADLRTANLEDADLKNVDLKDANLEDAILRYADLRGANLKDAFLTQTISQNIQGQKVISFQVDTSRINNSISYWKDLGVWTTGCFQGTLEELQERVAETHKDNTFLRERYERVIAFILSEAEQDDKKADQRQLIGNILKKIYKLIIAERNIKMSTPRLIISKETGVSIQRIIEKFVRYGVENVEIVEN